MQGLESVILYVIYHRQNQKNYSKIRRYRGTTVHISMWNINRQEYESMCLCRQCCPQYGQQQCLLHRFTFFSFFLHSTAALLCNPRHSDTPAPLLNPSSAPKAKQFAFLSTFPNFFLLIFFSSVPSSRYFLHVPCPKARLYSTWGAEVVAIATILCRTCNTQQYVNP